MIAYEVVHTYQIVRDCVHSKNHGNPSGNIFTTIINSDTNDLELRMSYVDSAMELALDGTIPWEETTPNSYDDNVCMATFGDDMQCAVKHKAALILNGLVHSEFMMRHKRIFTPANKLAMNNDLLVPLEELTFLKRTFVSHPSFPQYKLAPIATKSITELVQWIRRSPDDVAATKVNIQTAMRFAYHHGRKFYEDLRDELNGAILSRGINLPLIPNLYVVEDGIWLSKFAQGIFFPSRGKAYDAAQICEVEDGSE